MTAATPGKVRVRPGRRYPLGATPGPDGTNFAVSSGVADEILLCLFDETGAETRVTLPEYDAGVWHGFVEGVGAARPGPPAKVHPSEPTCDPAHHLVEQLLPAGRVYL
jgi:isoamylase